MGDSIGGTGTRICSYCSSRNKAEHRYCVRCSAPLDAAGPMALAASPGGGPSRARRYLLAAGVAAAIAAGFMVNAVLRASHEAPTLSEDARADSTALVEPLPPPPVSGWTPGRAEAPEAAPAPLPAAPAWSSTSFPVARPNPYDVPGDPSASMVGIAPRAPRDRGSVAGKRAFTDDDLLQTRN